MSIESMSPPEIDGQIAELGIALAKVHAEAAGVEGRLARSEAAKRPWDRLSATEVEKLQDRLAELADQAGSLNAAMRPYEEEYARRGGWTRAYLVQNPGGHLHKATSCSTCYPTTQFAWLTYLSGQDEAGIVEEAGERACTVCYPQAPVNVLQRASRLRPDVEARAEIETRRSEKAQKAAEKAAKAITMPDGSPLRTRYSEARTVVSAWREAVGAAASLLWYSADHPSAPEWRDFIDRAVEALSAKLDRDPEGIREEIARKAEAKHKRDSKEAEKYRAALGL